MTSSCAPRGVWSAMACAEQMWKATAHSSETKRRSWINKIVAFDEEESLRSNV